MNSDMRRKFQIILLILIILTGCERRRVPRIVIGKGDIVTETIAVNPFHSVILVGMENLTLNTGESQVLKISAQENILEVMSTKVSDGVLTIDFKPKVKVTTADPILIEITHPDLSMILLEGIGNFELDGEQEKDIELEFAGTGNMDAYGLYLTICDFILSGNGNCDIRADSILNVTLSGIGNIIYYGDPELNTVITGIGNVTKGD